MLLALCLVLAVGTASADEPGSPAPPLVIPEVNQVDPIIFGGPLLHFPLVQPPVGPALTLAVTADPQVLTFQGLQAASAGRAGGPVRLGARSTRLHAAPPVTGAMYTHRREPTTPGRVR